MQADACGERSAQAETLAPEERVEIKERFSILIQTLEPPMPLLTLKFIDLIFKSFN